MTNNTNTGKDLAVIQNLKQTLNANYKQAIQNYLGDEKKALRFLSSVVTAVQKNPELQKCTPTSLINSFISAAELGLYPSNVAGECYVVPYKGMAQFQLGYQGYQTLFYRAGGVKIESRIVHENDSFEFTYGLEPHLHHTPAPFGTERGKAIGAYAVATLEGGDKIFEVMSADDIMKHKAKSQNAEGKYSPWNPENDPNLTMWKKTVIKQLAKSLPKNETIYKAQEAEEKGSIIDLPTKDTPQSAKNLADTVDETETEEENKEPDKQAVDKNLEANYAQASDTQDEGQKT